MKTFINDYPSFFLSAFYQRLFSLRENFFQCNDKYATPRKVSLLIRTWIALKSWDDPACRFSLILVSPFVELVTRSTMNFPRERYRPASKMEIARIHYL